MILQPYHLPPLLLPVSNSCLFMQCQPLYARCCSVLFQVLFKVLYGKIKNVFFIFLFVFLMHYLCEKYYKPIRVQYFIADCVSSVPRLSLLDLQIVLMSVLLEWNSLVCSGLAALRQWSLMCLTMSLLGFILP